MEIIFCCPLDRVSDASVLLRRMLNDLLCGPSVVLFKIQSFSKFLDKISE